MQVRKLVKSGYASLVIAVPKDWTKRNKLNAGDLVYITEDANKLSITTKFKEEPAEKREILIDVDGKEEGMVRHEISSAYLDNFHSMIIKGKDLGKMIKVVKKQISGLIALELVEESSDRIVARSFINLYDIDLKLLVRRMDNIIRSMMIDTEDAVKNAQLVPAIIDRDEEVNKLSFLVFKILKAAYLDRKILDALKLEEMDILRYWELTIHLEKIGDRIKNIANKVLKLNQLQQKRFVELFSNVEMLHKDVMKAFYNFSKSESDEVSKKRNSVLSDVERYIKSSNCVMCSQVAIHVFNMIGNINDISRIIRYLD